MKLAIVRRTLLISALAALLIRCAVAASPEIIELTELPEPPQQVRRLIDRGPLEWVSGVDEEQQQSADKPRLAAETKYQIRYSYSVRTKWKVNQSGSKVAVTVRFTCIAWKTTHRIWFLEQSAIDDFWSDTIVRHELDHLRISSDPRHASRSGCEKSPSSNFRSRTKMS